jgi:hypothetical protein
LSLGSDFVEQLCWLAADILILGRQRQLKVRGDLCTRVRHIFFAVTGVNSPNTLDCDLKLKANRLEVVASWAGDAYSREHGDGGVN